MSHESVLVIVHCTTIQEQILKVGNSRRKGSRVEQNWSLSNNKLSKMDFGDK
jgi:hypothetical protein